VEVGNPPVIVDTNALSAIADERDRIRELLGTARGIAVPVIAIGEYRSGIARSRDFLRYQQWLDEFILASRVLDIDESTTRSYAEISLELRKAGKPIPTNDIWIAALCRQHELPLLSRDRHFDTVNGIQRIEW
jgi:predicted nucleic acid-binding protein